MDREALLLGNTFFFWLTLMVAEELYRRILSTELE
jgi:hypothetical protein